jgi:hypothetical protein
VIGGLGALTYVLIEGQFKGWGTPLILTLFAAAALLLFAFLLVEARIRGPLLPLSLLSILPASISIRTDPLAQYRRMAPC